MSKPLSSGPILPLAIMAMFAVMIPLISVMRGSSVTNSQAKMRVPTNEPHYLVPAGSPTPTPMQNSNGSMMNY